MAQCSNSDSTNPTRAFNASGFLGFRYLLALLLKQLDSSSLSSLGSTIRLALEGVRVLTHIDHFPS